MVLYEALIDGLNNAWHGMASLSVDDHMQLCRGCDHCAHVGGFEVVLIITSHTCVTT